MKKIFATLAVVLISTTLLAEDKSSGCGAGWQVTKSMTTSGSVTRSLTNATFSQSLAMTSGTSGCAKHDLVMQEKEKIHYVESNLIPLRREVAMGEGERINALAAIWGCQNAESVSPSLKRNYRQLFYKKNPSEVVQGLNTLLASCSLKV